MVVLEGRSRCHPLMRQILENSKRFVNRLHFSKKRFRGNILLVWPGNGTTGYAYLIKIIDVPQFPEDTKIKIRLHVKYTFSPPP